ncbi:MAG TPA: Asp-tRNA(Asn)/Glu-tRNA(Gln) amidotransferase subunit GatC [Desulfobacteraceae bacterium]|nr:Asp-tRNA(Asn)/Glu-tRNA(Gln) amidotransferase subunit GatC [Deltaproteobacteria bacterium]RLB94770.1 MAG: Asp-tRNA(Asn)/Glu-tRNA(Gln) amidotransferase subunit GatB [Deltaproteobacteria bacterium]HDI60902.1 Asp-tRNA(Asn)/Glu-tRNA(Gln) amidotransferase subunit GatC [Desulfobacteraceae bacterium]
MSITRQDVIHVANLARLELDPAVIDDHVARLTEILEYVAKLNEVDTGGVEPTSHASEHTNAFREDVARPGLAPEHALRNAPESEEQQFVVPKIVG